MCGREEMRGDGVLGLGQVVKDVKGESTVGNWQLRVSGGVRGGQYDRPGCRSNEVHSLLPLCSLMLKAGDQDCQDIQRLFRGT